MYSNWFKNLMFIERKKHISLLNKLLADKKFDEFFIKFIEYVSLYKMKDGKFTEQELIALPLLITNYPKVSKLLKLHHIYDLLEISGLKLKVTSEFKKIAQTPLLH